MDSPKIDPYWLEQWTRSLDGNAPAEQSQEAPEWHKEFTEAELQRAERVAKRVLGPFGGRDDTDRLQGLLDQGVSIRGGTWVIRRTLRVPSGAYMEGATIHYPPNLSPVLQVLTTPPGGYGPVLSGNMFVPMKRAGAWTPPRISESSDLHSFPL